MLSKLGLYQSVAIGAVVVAVAGWAIYTQTDLVRPAPVIEAADGPIVVAGDDEVAEETTAIEASDDAEALVDEADEEQTEEAVAESEDVPAEETEAVVDEETADAEDEYEPQAAPDFAAPAFEVVRVESDGLTVIAGTGPIGWLISILVDDVVVETVTADASGQFVAILDIGESDAARVITLSAKDGDRMIMSDAQVIIAPVVRQKAEVVEEPSEEATADTDDVAVGEEETTKAAEPYVEDMSTMETVEADDAGEAVEDATTTLTSDTDDTAATTTEEVAQSGEQDAVEVQVEATDAVAQSEDQGAVAEQVVSGSQEATTPEVGENNDEAENQVAETQTHADATEDVAAVEPTADSGEETAAVETSVDETVEAPEASSTSETSETVQVEAVEDAAPAVLLVENDSVTVLQPSSEGPQVLDELSIAAISYSDEGAVQLSGFSPAGFLRVYLNNVQIAVLEVPEPGEWATELADIAPGIYTLRIDQVDADGQVVQRVETPFKREEPEKVVTAAKTRKPLISVQVVQPGSTLWAISRENYGSGVLFVRIFEANKDQIRNPDLIYPGQIFDLPAPPGAKKKKGTSGQ